VKAEIGNNLNEFLNRTRTFLEKDKVLHSFLLGLCSKLSASGKSVHLSVSVADSAGDVKLAGVQTDAFRLLILSKGTEEAIDFLVEELKRKKISIPGVSGPQEVADRFHEGWKSPSKAPVKMRLFSLNQLVSPPSPEGRSRPAEKHDHDVIFKWLREFHAEAVPNDPSMSDADLSRDILDAIEKRQYIIWEAEGEPVSLVGSRRETEYDRWIAPVYTPKELRGNGYASALTADVSRAILESGKTAMLFTDLSNPTSNSIYQKIGYRVVADFANYFFY
jgi:predicted GNAT family acetyltransferase